MGRMVSSGVDPGYAVFAMSDKGEIQPPGGEHRRFANRQEAETERKRLELELGISHPPR